MNNRLEFRPVLPGKTDRGGLGIPVLDREMLGSDPPSKTAISVANPGELVVIRTVTNGDFSRCTLATFCDDYRFSGCWTRPECFLDGMRHRGYAQACSPDFSTYVQSPLIEQMYAVFRSAWVSRYWQLNGIKIIPSLTWSDDRSYEFAWCHIPRRPPLAIVDARATAAKTDGFQRGLNAALRAVQPDRLIVYGSGEITANCPVIRLDAWAPHRRIANKTPRLVKPS
jgi:hypothetical protein